ncbi:fatty acid desaturase [Streptomyces roseoverticillatus]|uniref:fatty acid desaturase n=1 Tax=Streptomyces roseoverticillatus TaxID=66429 RepID=UPI001F3FF57D|nr:fatty acid desaturase [Streptomyces roseoverticillatus]MCF3106980.1 fatty acid desaturase [Streptomyces roseoverticillatus]
MTVSATDRNAPDHRAPDHGDAGSRAAGDGRPRTATSVRLTCLALAVGLCQLFVLPLWLLPADPAWGWALVPLVLTTTPLWSLVHEGIHGTLLADRPWNDRCGRALAVLHGAPFVVLKTGHLLHHRYSRTPRERTEVYDARATTWAKAAPGYYARLLGGLYLMESASVLLALLPATLLRRLARSAEAPDTVAGPLLDRLARRRALRQLRTDAAAVAALYAAAFAAYGEHAWMLVAALAGRALVVSLSDNAYHYATPLDAPLQAMNLRLPRPLEAFALGFNLHGVHHRHPGLPWSALRARFAREGGRYDLGWMPAVARQLRGPVRAGR